MQHVFVDLETRSEIDIKKCGGGAYCAHESTEIICYCYAVEDGPIVRIASGDVGPLIDLKRDGATFVAHNAAFEAAMFNKVGLGAAKFICTMALGQSHGLPGSLERMAKALQLGYQKNMSGTRLINKFSKPNRHGEFNEMDEQDMKELLDYCADDVAVERTIVQRLPKLTHGLGSLAGPRQDERQVVPTRSRPRRQQRRPLECLAGLLQTILLDQGQPQIGLHRRMLRVQAGRLAQVHQGFIVLAERSKRPG